jgi:hypothetical protein
MTHFRYALIAVTTAATARTSAADTSINFFGDVAYNVARHGEDSSNSFQAATLDIFAMQKEGKFGFMGEIVGQAFGTNDFSIDIDRLEASYEPRPWLRIRAGRLRTAWGYYGDAYQNGKFFMVPVMWPEAYESLTEDGIIPMHGVGLHVDAKYSLGEDAGKLTADAEVLNGRGSTIGAVASFADENNGKAVNVRLRYVGGGTLEGLTVGGNVYVDQIPGDMEAGTPAMHELILGGHAAYFGHDFHAIAEVAWFRHRANGMPTIYGTLNGFAEVGYTIKDDVTPYLRYQRTQFAENGDPYFAEKTAETDLYDRLSAGAKYTASASVALKLEASAQRDDDDFDFIGIAQAAFAF